MNRLFSTLAAAFKSTNNKSRPLAQARRFRPGVEGLEARQVMSATQITDMTEWARQFAGPTHAQQLYLNFDGKHNDGNNVAALTPKAGEDRDTAIQNIIYEVSEIFSPFNVQVKRQFGDGVYTKTNGDSTVFIGGDSANVTSSGKFTYSSTPWNFADYPSAYRGVDHVPNSDPYDLAFVDPMAYSSRGSNDPALKDPTKWSNVSSDIGIAQAIAHEAGHTFGLAHVYSSPVNEIMSYNAGNQYFANQAFNITDVNNSGTSTSSDAYHARPESHQDLVSKIEIPIAIQTQNSFTYLQTVLGKRASDGYVHASDSNTVDASSTNLHSDIYIGPISNKSIAVIGGDGIYATHAFLTRIGDFDAFKLRSNGKLQYHIDVTPDVPTQTHPDLFVKDSSGNVLFFNHSGATAHIDFQATAGQVYTVVVGSEDTYGYGGFTIKTSESDPVPNLTGATFTFSLSTNAAYALGRLDIQYEDVNTGTFWGVYHDFAGMAISGTGKVSNTRFGISDFSFTGFAQAGDLYGLVQYSGKLTGSGYVSAHGWSDTLDGTLIEQVFQTPQMGLLWTRGGPAMGKDF